MWDGPTFRQVRSLPRGVVCMCVRIKDRGAAAAASAGHLGPRRLPALLFPLAFLTLLGGCSGGSSSVSPGLGARDDSYDPRWGVSASRRVVSAGPIPKGGGHYKLGRPYQVAGRWYVPRHEPYYDRTGVGSWYGEQFHGRKTANGEIFDMNALTAAHPTLPMPSYAYVTNLRNGRTLLVRINDRGPYVANREIDLSRASAQALGYAKGGLGQVRVRWAGHAPMSGDDRRELAFLRQQPWFAGNDGPVASYDQRRPVARHGDDRASAPPQYYEREPSRSRDNGPGDNGLAYAAYDQPGRGRDPRQMADDGRAAWRNPDEDMAPKSDRYEDPAPASSRYAEMDRGGVASDAVYDRAPSPPPAPRPAPETLWSPFDHRESLRSSTPRR